MILSPEVAKQAASLAETPDEILPLFPPLERAVIMVAKEIMKKERKYPAVQAGREHLEAGGTQQLVRPATT